MMMPGRKYNTESYAYGFNGKRKDNEMYGEGNAYDFGNRILDPRLGGRWLSVDPLQHEYPGESPYLYTGGNPIIFTDPDGRDRIITITRIAADGKTIVIEKIDKNDFHYYTGNTTNADGRGGGIGYYKADIVQNVFIDERWGTPAMIYTEDRKVNPQQISPWEYSVLSDIHIPGISGDASNKVKYGYMIYGKHPDMKYSDKLPRAADGSETLELSSFLDMLGGMREGATVRDIYAGVGGNEPILIIIETVETFNGAVERIDATIKATDNLQGDKTATNNKPAPVERTDTIDGEWLFYKRDKNGKFIESGYKGNQKERETIPGTNGAPDTNVKRVTRQPPVPKKDIPR